ncbi:hypothetical protein FPV67DRAFT_837461 [Lyophyllum atratum]|nr:hypothetical protein FPV67DRAFT_837461 [Lyophyllum atratum]
MHHILLLYLAVLLPIQTTGQTVSRVRRSFPWAFPPDFPFNDTPTPGMPPLPAWMTLTYPAYPAESSQSTHHPVVTPPPAYQTKAPLVDESTTRARPNASASSTRTSTSSSSKTSANSPNPSSLVSSSPSATLPGEAASSGTKEPLATDIPPSRNNNLIGAIVSGVLGGLAVFILLSVICYQFRRRRRSGAIPVLVPLHHDPYYTQPSGRNEKPAHTPMAIDHPRDDAEVADSISRIPSSIRKGPRAQQRSGT